jgi:hypothetical protein
LLAGVTAIPPRDRGFSSYVIISDFRRWSIPPFHPFRNANFNRYYAAACSS